MTEETAAEKSYSEGRDGVGRRRSSLSIEDFVVVSQEVTGETTEYCVQDSGPKHFLPIRGFLTKLLPTGNRAAAVMASITPSLNRATVVRCPFKRQDAVNRAGLPSPTIDIAESPDGTQPSCLQPRCDVHPPLEKSGAVDKEPFVLQKIKLNSQDRSCDGYLVLKLQRSRSRESENGEEVPRPSTNEITVECDPDLCDRAQLEGCGHPSLQKSSAVDDEPFVLQKIKLNSQDRSCEDFLLLKPQRSLSKESENGDEVPSPSTNEITVEFDPGLCSAAQLGIQTTMSGDKCEEDASHMETRAITSDGGSDNKCCTLCHTHLHAEGLVNGHADAHEHDSQMDPRSQNGSSHEASTPLPSVQIEGTERTVPRWNIEVDEEDSTVEKDEISRSPSHVAADEKSVTLSVPANFKPCEEPVCDSPVIGRGARALMGKAVRRSTSPHLGTTGGMCYIKKQMPQKALSEPDRSQLIQGDQLHPMCGIEQIDGEAGTQPTEKHIRDTIHRRCNEFVKFTNWSSLLPHLESEQLLDPDSTHRLQTPYSSSQEKGNYFYLTVLPSKGHEAYSRFYRCLTQEREHIGHRSLLEMF